MKEQVSCPAVIKSYNANMGGIDKSDMLVHLYHIPMKSKRNFKEKIHMQIFAYAIDSQMPRSCTDSMSRLLLWVAWR